MSIRLMTEAWECLQIETASELMVLLVICDHANDQGICFPSNETIARRARCSTRSVRRFTAKFQQMGILRIDQNKGRNLANLYRIDMARLAMFRAQSEAKPDNSTVATVATLQGQGWPLVTTTLDTAGSKGGHGWPTNHKNHKEPFAREGGEPVDDEIGDGEYWQSRIDAEKRAHVSSTASKQSNDEHKKVLDFYAQWINGEAVLFSNAVSPSMARELLAAQLVTEDRLRERGVVYGKF